jgi:glycosyltransferase involved in cell wall biosynthesis
MRVLLSNKYYYPRGGSDIYMIELERILKEHGHEVAVFSMQHHRNMKSEFFKYFPGEVDLNNKELSNLIPSLLRPFGSAEVRMKFNRLLDEFKPDLVHLNNIHSQLSPILSVLAKNLKVPVVWTLHDHKLLCPRYDCMRNNQPCELCFSGKFNVVRYRCMKHSYTASLVAYAEALLWNRERISRSTDIFICPSLFLLNNMIKGSFKSEQLVSMSNFVNENKFSGIIDSRERHYCYVGRLSSEKGIETLLKAAVELPQYPLKVIGTGPLESELKSKYQSKHIEFMGFREWEDLKAVLGCSVCMIIPSECYENNPLSVIESLCMGTPVIGSNIGGIPELITEGKNGSVFEPGNVVDLRDQIIRFFETPVKFDYREIASEAKARFRSGNYYDQLMKIYNQVLKPTEQIG